MNATLGTVFGIMTTQMYDWWLCKNAGLALYFRTLFQKYQMKKVLVFLLPNAERIYVNLYMDCRKYEHNKYIINLTSFLKNRKSAYCTFTWLADLLIIVIYTIVSSFF